MRYDDPMTTLAEIEEAICKLSGDDVVKLAAWLDTMTVGIDDEEVTPGMREAMEEAERDRASGNREAFIGLEDLRAEFAAADT